VYLPGIRPASTRQEIAFLLAGLRWGDGTPVDPAMGKEWRAAAQSVRKETVEKQ
jgi:hypothetical protein